MPSTGPITGIENLRWVFFCVTVEWSPAVTVAVGA